jgi:hypothetical protein
VVVATDLVMKMMVRVDLLVVDEHDVLTSRTS